MATESNATEMTAAETHEAVDMVADAMQAAAQTARHTFTRELWQQAHRLVTAGGSFAGTGKPELDEEIKACWGEWTNEKPHRKPWDGAEVPARFQVPSPVAGPLGRAVAVSTGLAAGVHDKSKRPKHRVGHSPSKWGWAVIDRALTVANLPDRYINMIESEPYTFTKLVWARCVSLDGPDTAGGKGLVGTVLNEMCGGFADETRTDATRRGGRKASGPIDTTAPGYIDPGLRYWDAK